MTHDAIKLARIKSAMVAYFHRFPVGVSFANLQGAVGDEDALGEYMYGNAACSRLNICWWVGVSLEFCNALTELVQSDAVTPYPTSILTYMVDGRLPSMPLARDIDPEVPYLHLHWTPVAFDLTRAS